jgi:hypothetical protein
MEERGHLFCRWAYGGDSHLSLPIGLIRRRRVW